jgi:hypothetical protein
VWGPFTAQAGTYEVKGSEVTYRPSVAKNPNVMAPGNFMTDTFKIEGNTLTLVSNANRGAKEGVPEEDIGVGLRMRSGNPATIKLTRVE